MTNNLKRIYSSIILTPLSLFIIIEGSIIFNIFVFLCAIIAIFEWLKMNSNIFLKISGLLFIIFSFYSIHQIRNINDTDNLHYFLIIFSICVASDIGGFVIGNIFKGPKLTMISPKKTYSGMIGSFIFSILLIYILSNFILNYKEKFDLNFYFFVILVSAISQLGDLTISFFKRKSNLKDTGNLIPGHGGILDRLDGMIFVFPITYIFNYLI